MEEKLAKPGLFSCELSLLVLEATPRKEMPPGGTEDGGWRFGAQSPRLDRRLSAHLTATSPKPSGCVSRAGLLRILFFKVRVGAAAG